MGRWITENIDRLPQPNVATRVSIKGIFGMWEQDAKASGMDTKEFGDTKIMAAKLSEKFDLNTEEHVHQSNGRWYHILRYKVAEPGMI